MLKLIEPKYKDKIGAGQSYPLNTEQISKALEGVPQYAELSLYYNNEIGDSLGALFLSKTSGKNVKQDVSDLLGFREVISARYSLTHLLPAWSITIPRVNSIEKKEINAFILSVGLPLLREWLATNRPETWYNGRRYFQIGLSKSKDQYAVRESFNDQLVAKQILQIEI
jgi:hypothetical protein